MDKIQKMGVFGQPDWLEYYDHDSPDSREGFTLAGTVWTNLLRFHDEIDDALVEIDRDPNLSETGKTKKRKELPSRFRRRFDQLKACHETANTHLERKATELFPVDDEPSTAEVVAFAAIWAKLPDDSFRVEQYHREAVAKGQIVVARAIETMPHFFDGALHAEKVALLRNERLGKSIDPISRSHYDRFKDAVGDGRKAIEIVEERLQKLSAEVNNSEQLMSRIENESVAE